MIINDYQERLQAEADVNLAKGVTVSGKARKRAVSVSDPRGAHVSTGVLEVEMSKETRAKLESAFITGMPCALYGHTGTGKTQAIKWLASLRGLEVVRVNLTGNTEETDLIGGIAVKDGATYFKKGVVLRAIEEGKVLVLDEVNGASPRTLFALHSLLDDDKALTLPDGTVVRAHPNFRVFATYNPNYAGTTSQNEAFMNRFTLKVEFTTLEPKKEIALLVKRTGIAEEQAEQLVIMATKSREAFKENRLSVYVSTRTLLGTCRAIQAGLDIKLAYEACIASSGNDEDERKALFDFYLSVKKEAEKPDRKSRPVIITAGELEDMQEKVKQFEAVAGDLDKLKELQSMIKKLA